MAFSMMDICRSNFETDWKQCPNCCQPYNKTICKPIAQALVQFSDDRNLPKTHFVWFEARVVRADTLLYTFQTKEEIDDAIIQIEFLLTFVEEEYAALAAEWWGDETKGQLLKECQSGKLLQMLGRAQKALGTALKSLKLDRPAKDANRASLDCFENALRNMQSATDRGQQFDSEIQETEGYIRNVKFELGLITIDEQVEDIRKRLKDFERAGADGLDIVDCKSRLSDALIKKDPPEYFEAIKLRGEILTWLERALGPDHDLVRITKRDLSDLKQDYRHFLKRLNDL